MGLDNGGSGNKDEKGVTECEMSGQGNKGVQRRQEEWKRK